MRVQWGEVQQVLVLNASYEPLNVCSVRRAHVLVYKGKAEVLEKLERPLHSASDTYPWPHVIRLCTYVHVPRAAQRKISRRALFARDGWRCVYCGTSANCTGGVDTQYQSEVDVGVYYGFNDLNLFGGLITIGGTARATTSW